MDGWAEQHLSLRNVFRDRCTSFHINSSQLTLSGRIGNAVAYCVSKVTGSIRLTTLLICSEYASGAQEVLPSEGLGVTTKLTIGSTVFGSMDRSWQWLTATGSCPLG